MAVRIQDNQIAYIYPICLTFLQSYFSRGGAPFIGMIVSPYNPSNSSPVSQKTCLLVEEETSSAGTQSKYCFNDNLK